MCRKDSDDIQSLVSKKLLLETEKQVNDLYVQLGQVDFKARREALGARGILWRNCEQVSVHAAEAGGCQGGEETNGGVSRRGKHSGMGWLFTPRLSLRSAFI